MSLNYPEHEQRLDLISLIGRGIVLNASTQSRNRLRVLSHEGRTLPFAVDISGAIFISDDPHEILFRLPADEVLLRGDYLPDGKVHVGVNEFPSPSESKTLNYDAIRIILSNKVTQYLNET